MSNDINDFSLPSDPDDLKFIKGAIEDIVAQQRFIKDRQENIKDIKTELKDRFDMPTSLANKLVKAFHDEDYQAMISDHSMFEFVRESVLGDAGLPDDNAVDNDESDAA